MHFSVLTNENKTGAQDWLSQPETQRRKSWTALEDLSNTGKMKHARQRRCIQINNLSSNLRVSFNSISLSSMESEADESSLIDNVDGSTARLLGPDAPVIIRHRTRASTGGASTHSLNEADLQVCYFYSPFNPPSITKVFTERL